jgi:hypothetical protein
MAIEVLDVPAPGRLQDCARADPENVHCASEAANKTSEVDTNVLFMWRLLNTIE